MKKVLLIAPVTDRIEDKTKCVTHYANIGDVLVVHSVRYIILNNFPLASITVLSSNKRIINENELNKYDLIIVCGGGIIHETGLSLSGFLVNIEPSIIDKITTPIIVNAIGYNVNFEDKDISEGVWNNIVTLLNKSIICSARDTNTISKIKCAGYKREIYQTLDPVYEYSKKVVSEKEQDLIGLVVNESLNDVYIELINSMPDKKFSLIHHVPDVVGCAEYIISKCSNVKDNGFTINIEQFYSYYKECNIIVGANYHQMIIASAMGKGFVNLEYNYKNTAFYQDHDIEKCNIVNFTAIRNAEIIKSRIKSCKRQVIEYPSNYPKLFIETIRGVFL